MEEAVKNYQKALSLLERKKNYQLLSKIYTNLGRIYLMNDLYRSALNSYKEGFYCDSLLNQKIDMSFDLRGIAIAYQFIEKEDSALFYFNKAYAICQAVQDSSIFSPLILGDLIAYYMNQKDYKKAFLYLSQLENLSIAEKSSDIYYYKSCLFNKTHKYDSAYYYLNMNINTCDIYDRVTYYDQLRIAAKGMGDYQKATFYAEMYEAGVDSIFRMSKSANIQKAENDYKTIELKSAHQSKIKMLLLFPFLLIFIAISLIIYKRTKTKISSNMEKHIYEVEEVIIKSFQLMPIYKRIQELPKNKKELSSKEYKPFTLEEFDELRKTIKNIFSKFIHQLNDVCPLLTEEDIIFCCLIKVDLPVITIAYCFMSFNTNPLKQRKKRIKEKMTVQTDNIELFESIFPEKKKYL